MAYNNNLNLYIVAINIFILLNSAYCSYRFFYSARLCFRKSEKRECKQNK